MKTDNNIPEELRQISPVVAEISRKNLFKVPENYFEQFAGDLLLRIKSMQQTETFSSSLHTIDKNIPLSSPPAGYFEGFAEKMLARVKAANIISVDEELAGISPVLSKLKREMPFSVPQGYFENFSNNVVESARAIGFINNEQETLSPLLSELKNKSTYTTPLGYFENFPVDVLSKIKIGSKKTKVISINSKTWLRVAAAAVVVGIITTVSYYAINKNSAQQTIADPVAALSKLSDDDMVNYLQNQDMPVLDSTTLSGPLASIDLSIGDNGHDLLNDVSDDELQQYIKEDISYKDDDIN